MIISLNNWANCTILKNYVSISYEEAKSCIVNSESIYSRIVCDIILCPKIFLINTLQIH